MRLTWVHMIRAISRETKQSIELTTADYATTPISITLLMVDLRLG